MYKIIGLMGEAGSGKDTLMQRILSKETNLHEIVSCTTRPKREGEQEGINYFYYTPDQFANKVINEEMLEATFFNNWFYGTSYDSVDSNCVNIGVFNPTGIEFLQARQDVDLKLFYIHANPKLRLLRQLNREDNPDVSEIVRRFSTDQEDFKNLDDLKPITILNETTQDLDKARDFILSETQAWRSIKGKER